MALYVHVVPEGQHHLLDLNSQLPRRGQAKNLWEQRNKLITPKTSEEPVKIFVEKFDDKYAWYRYSGQH